MKFSIRKILLFIVFISSSFVYSQNSARNIGYDESSFLAFDAKVKTFQFVAETHIGKKEIALENARYSEGVNIKQIGSGNNLNINLKAELVLFAITQNGANNQLELDKEAYAIKQKVVQEGQNNSIKDFSMYSGSNVNMEFIQQGNNQNIQNYGANSISENMKVIQSGNGAAVIIINSK
jgi:hypothetical protein